MSSRKLIVFRHASALGNARTQDLFGRVKVFRRHQGPVSALGDAVLDNAPPARNFADYDIQIEHGDLGVGVEILEFL